MLYHFAEECELPNVFLLFYGTKALFVLPGGAGRKRVRSPGARDGSAAPSSRLPRDQPPLGQGPAPSPVSHRGSILQSAAEGHQMLSTAGLQNFKCHLHILL